MNLDLLIRSLKHDLKQPSSRRMATRPELTVLSTMQPLSHVFS